MIDIVDKKDIAKRKPYRLSPKVLQKIMNSKKAKKIKLQKMADRIITINDLTQSMTNDIMYQTTNAVHQNIRNKQLAFDSIS